MSEARPQRLPGDRKPAEAIARMLRVDHAGEYGATRIYEGQLDVLGRTRRMTNNWSNRLRWRFDQ